MFPSFGLGSGSRGRDAATVVMDIENGIFNAKLNETERGYIESMRSMSVATIRVTKESERLAATIKAMGDSAFKNGQLVGKARDAYIRFAQAEEAALREANKLNGAMQRQSGTMGGSIRRLAAYTGGFYLLGRAFTSTIRAAADYQRSMNILGVVSGATADQMARAGAEAKRLGADVTLPATSAADAAQVMTTLAKSGFDVEQSMRSAEGVLRLAAAAQIEVGDATKITASAIKAFNLEASASTSNKVADMFAAVANASLGEIPDFALGLAQASTVAKDWNLSLDETIATLGVFADNAIVGSDAGTSLRVMLTRLTGVSETAKKKMQELNISAFVPGTKQIKSYRDILQDYHDALVKLSPEEQKLAVQVIFGQDAQRAASKAILGTLLNYDKMLAKVQEVGAATKFSTAINEGAAGAWDAFNSSVETLQISLGEKALPTITRGITDLKNWVDGVEESGAASTEFASAIDDADGIVRGFAGAIRTASAVLRPFVNALGGVEAAAKFAFGVWFIIRLRAIAAGLGLVRTSAAGAAAQMTALAAAEQAAAVAGGRLGAILGRIGPLGWVQLAALGLIAYNSASGSPSQAAGGFGEPITKTPDGRKVYIKDGKMYANAPGLDTATESSATVRGGSGAAIRLYEYNPRDHSVSMTGERRPDRPDPSTSGGSGSFGGGRRGGGGAAGDGLSQIQRLQLALGDAELTKGAADDLRAQRAVVAYYQNIVKNGKLTGDKLFEARQALQRELRRQQQIEDDIARDRERAVKQTADKRSAAQKKIDAAQYKLDSEASNRMRKLLDKAVYKVNSSGQWEYMGKDGKGGGMTANEQAARDFLAALTGVAREYASNVNGPAAKAIAGVNVIQNFNANTPPFQAARESRAAMNAVYAGGM